MLTWHIDRIFRSGPLCAVATLALPAALAVLVASVSTEENILGILLIGAAIIFIGSLVGSALTSGAGIALFSMGTIVAEVPVALMALVGIGLYTALVIHDLAGAFHRGPRIGATVWRNAAVSTGAIVTMSCIALAVSYTVAKLATWQAIVVPFGIAAIGFGAKLAADSHRTSARELTAKRNASTAEQA